MKKIIGGLIPPLFLIIIALFGLFWWNSSGLAPSPDDAKSYPFIIHPGQNATSIARELEKSGFVKSELAFRLFVQIKGTSDKIQAGDYRLEKNKSLSELVGELTRGPIAIWTTLPEGLRKEEIAQKVASALSLQNQERIKFINEFMEEVEGKEGHLFPDTYLFLKNTTVKGVVEKLTSTFDSKTKSLQLSEADIILASIIERETRTDAERPVVAGILLKRLEIGMPLQTDATLQYAVATSDCSLITNHCQWWEPITVADKTIKSPYNTYTNRELPPRPIANPGLSSLKAAANPEKSPYLFYLHGNDSQIHYAKTIDEHNENVNKYLRY